MGRSISRYLLSATVALTTLLDAGFGHAAKPKRKRPIVMDIQMAVALEQADNTRCSGNCFYEAVPVFLGTDVMYRLGPGDRARLGLNVTLANELAVGPVFESFWQLEPKSALGVRGRLSLLSELGDDQGIGGRRTGLGLAGGGFARLGGPGRSRVGLMTSLDYVPRSGSSTTRVSLWLVLGREW